MYKLLLILKYLRRKLAPMFAALAVMLCTMMVIIVISVMGGFLRHLSESVQKLAGDVTITARSLTGFPHYGELIDKLEQRDAIAVATPIIHSYGLINIADRTMPVQIHGIRPEQLDQILPYRSTLRWSTSDLLADLPTLDEAENEQQRARIKQWRDEHRGFDLQAYGMTLQPPNDWPPRMLTYRRPDGEAPSDLAGAVLGIELTQRRGPDGAYRVRGGALGRAVTLTVVPLSEQGALGAYEPMRKKLTVLNEFKSGVYDIDSRRVYVRFDVLQRMLEMQPEKVWDKFDPETGEPIGAPTQRPGRATRVLVKGAEGFTLAQVQQASQQAAQQVMSAHEQMPGLLAMTWRQRHSDLLGAVQNEIGLVTFLFAIISLVAVVMVATTFYMTVLEKTRDIGVLRAVGASRMGIAGVFLGYGFAIGTVGALLGLAAAWGIVTHLNEIQTLLDQWFGWQMWDPQVYYFDKIPDEVDPWQATYIVIASILSSVVGALIPALLAARLDPVEALRYE